MRTSYFIAPDAADIDAEADIAAEDAASIADVAADEAAIVAADVSAGGVVTTVVVDGVAAGVTVVVSSFLVQAANETAAARVTISNAVFIFLLDLGSNNYRQSWEPLSKSPSIFKTWKSSSISSA